MPKKKRKPALTFREFLANMAKPIKPQGKPTINRNAAKQLKKLKKG